MSLLGQAQGDVSNSLCERKRNWVTKLFKRPGGESAYEGVGMLVGNVELNP